MRKAREKNGGLVLVQAIVFGSIGIVLVTALISASGANFKAAKQAALKEQAQQIAEAGVDYYRWHLAHDQDDYQDGTGGPGPYVHDFLDKNDNKIGEFSLDITPPPDGSTVVIIESTGTVLADPSIERTVRATLAIPSLAQYAVVANADMRFGEGTEVFGPIHSNGGIRFDGLAHNIVSSSQDAYDDPDHSGSDDFGVHTHVSPADPAASDTDTSGSITEEDAPVRTDVFEVGRSFPLQSVDFVGLTSNLAELKATAQEPEGHYFAASGVSGYRIVLRTDDTFDVYTVDTLAAVPHWSCSDPGQENWGTWSVGTNTLLGNFNNPDNGVIFFEDHVWAEGQIDGDRLTIAAGRFPDIPAQRRSITVNTDLLYTNYDGTDVIALIAQDDINVGLYSDDTFRIDAALIAQNGRVGRYYYRDAYWWWGWRQGCEPYHERAQITLYGMIGTNERYGFAYTDPDAPGYLIREINYDGNLLYGPPPSFPLTSQFYETIGWEQVR